MKIYLAARYSRFPEMQVYAEELRRLKIEVTSRWIKGDQDIRASGNAHKPHYSRLWAEEDLEDLHAADCVVSFTEGPEAVSGSASKGGRFVEFGLALALHKRVIVVGPKENVFHYLPTVEMFERWEDFLRYGGITGEW